MDLREMDLRLREELSCPICKEVMSQPMMTTCGHTFCAGCWDQFRGLTRANTCPLCRSTLLTPAVANRALWEVIRLVFPTTPTVQPHQTDFARFVQRIYTSMLPTCSFPRGYSRFLERKLATCCPNELTLCRCGLPALDRRVRKLGPNKGRPFSSCPLAHKGCGHFLWLDTNRDEE
jgi:hypothetical protein